jgi:hypothetical protein
MKRYRVVSVLLLVLLITAVFAGSLLAQDLDPENPEWLFEDNGNFEGWGNQNSLSLISVKGGVLTMETTGTDPYVFCGMGNVGLVWAAQPAYLNVDAKEHPVLYARMALSTNNNKVAFYYVTENDAQWSERQVMRWENLAPTGEMEEFEFEMDWEGTIIGIRMDFSDVAGIEIEIDYLSFVGHPGKPEAVQPVDKLATTWSGIRR